MQVVRKEKNSQQRSELEDPEDPRAPHHHFFWLSSIHDVPGPAWLQGQLRRAAVFTASPSPITVSSFIVRRRCSCSTS